VAIDLSSGQTRRVAQIGFSPFAKFSVSPDGRWLAYTEQQQSESDLMIVNDFH
jgi:hypothetical protein